MEPNVFWLTKDWKEHWEAADFEGLLTQAQASGTQFTCYDVPSRAFCDEDTLALGPVGMRCDEETAALLHDRATLPVPDTDIDLDVDVHWDGAQFWLRPACPAETLALLDRVPSTEGQERLRQALNIWLCDRDFLELVEQADRDEERLDLA